MIELSMAPTEDRSERPLHEKRQLRKAPGGPAGAIGFGPFRLVPGERLLLKSGKPVSLGSRALDILIALVERPGELVGKSELMARVWPSVTVVEDNLTVHMAALRRALADGQDGNRYIVTVPGRGYCFVASVAHEPRPRVRAAPTVIQNLRALVRPLVGRLDVVPRLAACVAGHRIVTITGPGGVGKSAVAASVGEALRPLFTEGVVIADLSALATPRPVDAGPATALRLTAGPDHARLPAAADLKGRGGLLILDNCECHVDGVAALIADLRRLAPALHILATSRAPLGVDGERVCRLSGLETPPVREFISAADASAFPSVQLFVEHAAACWGDFHLDDFDAPDVAQFCRRLDGVPLAIKLAAAHVGTLGVRGIRDCLGDRFLLLTGGEREAPLRQRSMLHSMAWTYELLTDVERSVLRSLAAFDGSFTLHDACEVTTDAGFADHELINAVRELCEKSLVLLDPSKSDPQLRLSEMTRAFIGHECRALSDSAVNAGLWVSRQALACHA